MRARRIRSMLTMRKRDIEIVFDCLLDEIPGEDRMARKNIFLVARKIAFVGDMGMGR